MKALKIFLPLVLLLLSCNASVESAGKTINGNAGSKLWTERFGTFNEPWAMTFLPDGDLLVTEKSGTLLLFKIHDRSTIPIDYPSSQV